MIGSAGGTVSAPDGPTLVVPAGAVTEPVTISITTTQQQVAGAVTPVFEFQPAGLTFAVPVTVTLPLATAQADVSVYWSKATGPGYDELPSQNAGTSVSAMVTHFSTGYAAPAGGDVTGTVHHYLVDHMDLPTTSNEARSFALDLNGDATVDNQLGMVFATFISMGWNLTGANAGGITAGEVHVRADLQATGLTAATNAGFTTYLGASPTDPLLAGTIVNGTLTTGSGHLALQLELNPGRPIELDLIGARAKVTGTATGLSASVLCGGVTMAQIDGVLLPEITFWLDQEVGAQCTRVPTSCGCPSGSNGASIVSLFDTDHDCTITVAEVQSNSLMQSLLAPDVTLEQQSALSLGIGFTGVATGP